MFDLQKAEESIAAAKDKKKKTANTGVTDSMSLTESEVKEVLNEKELQRQTETEVFEVTHHD